MMTLPLEFDTTREWRPIVKAVLWFVGAAVVLIAGALAAGKYGGAAGLALALLIVWWIARRVAGGFPLGAAGTLTADAVETRAVRVLWYRLPVPVGRFPVDSFASVSVVEYVILPTYTSGGRNKGVVTLVGKPGTPDIPVVSATIDEAMSAGHELGSLLGLESRHIDAAGSRAERKAIG